MKIKQIGSNVLNWFTRRAIETVDSWDGAASNYANTDAYCKACLIDVNPSGKPKAQSHCMLPVKAPGSSAYADKGIMAASGGRGLGAVKKPADVNQATFDAQVKKAAKTIVSAYKDMDKEAPASMMEMAGMARAISVDSIFQQLQCAMMDQHEMGMGMADMGYLVTVFIDSGELYALFNHEGLLQRAKLTLGDNDTVTLGPMEDVSQQFVPTTRSSVTVKRQADGNYRVFMLAGTALINKVGQIDSTKLYDDMIRRAEDYGYYPAIDFFHLGEDDASCEFGQVDWLGREGVCYLASGVLYKDHPLTEPVVRAINAEPEVWGNSIEYYPMPDSVDYVEVGKLEIPVFLEGLNTRISILPSVEAASWFTSVRTEQRAMNEKQKAALKKLLGEDEFNRRMADVEDVNGVVDKRKLIFRATSVDAPVVEAADGAAAEPVATPEAVDDKTTVQNEDAHAEPEIELDEEAVTAIAEAVTESNAFTTLFTALTDKVTALLADIATLQTNLTTAQATVTRSTKRLDALEQAEDEHGQVLAADQPRRVTDPKLRMVYRPRQQRAAEEYEYEEVEDSEAVAAATLDRIPKMGAYN